MARGHYDRAAARARREAADAARAESPAVADVHAADAAAVPTRVRLLAPHGYVECRFNRGVFRWDAGEVVTNPDEIAHLMERGAALEAV